ncbi:MAG: M14 family metallopeptidase [Nitrospinaceae bacterium]
MLLNTFDTIPDGLLTVDPPDIGSVLPRPSLIHIPGRTDPPLFVATLLHANETTGLEAIQKLLSDYRDSGRELPRSLMVFIGNVSAARENLRHLSGQPDYNRIWDGHGFQGEKSPERQMVEEVTQRAKASGIFASIDIHNTSGRNPHHACVNRIDPRMIHLGSLFSRTLVYFKRPGSVQSIAFSKFCPAITLEAGKPGEDYGVRHIAEFLELCLNLKSLPDSLEHPDNLNIYHSIAQVRVPKHSTVGFEDGSKNSDFRFIENLDKVNFTDLPANSLLGWRLNPELALSVKDEEGNEVADNYFTYDNGEIRLKREIVPSMFTTNERIIYQDCLGYLMERYTIQ